MKNNQIIIKSKLLAHKIYSITKKFPKNEIYGLTSQIRRASISVALNYIEGYARQNQNEMRRFMEISFGSLKETKFLLVFCCEEKLINQKDYKYCFDLTEEIAKMLWVSIKTLKSKKY